MGYIAIGVKGHMLQYVRLLGCQCLGVMRNYVSARHILLLHWLGHYFITRPILLLVVLFGDSTFELCFRKQWHVGLELVP